MSERKDIHDTYTRKESEKANIVGNLHKADRERAGDSKEPVCMRRRVNIAIRSAICTEQLEQLIRRGNTEDA